MGQVNICPELGVTRVVVYIPGRSFVARPLADGSFEINYIPPGTYDLAFEAGGEVVSTLSGIVVTRKQQTDLGTVSVCIDGDGDGWDASMDCNDSDPDINPDAVETCNARDDNCNAMVDEGLPTQQFYRDADGDGYGDPAMPLLSCAQPHGYVSNNQDCYDANTQVRPSQTSFFSMPRGDSDFDYNCDSIDEQRLTVVGSCSLEPTGCELVRGWAHEVPQCGIAQDTIEGCELGGFPPDCVADIGFNTQTCR